MKDEEVFKNARAMLLKFVADTAKEKNITQEELAIKTGFKQNNISRMLSGRYAPSLDNFLRLADAVGVNFFLESKDSTTENNQQFEEAMKSIGRRKDDSRMN